MCLAECNNFKEALCHTTESHGIHIIVCCKFCSTFFVDFESLKEHSKIHLIEYPCEFCEEICLSRSSLTRHVKSHPEYVALRMQEKFTCPYCNLTFDSFGAFKKHRRIHFRTLYTCEICGKSHGSKQLLEEHRFIHSNLKRYVCVEMQLFYCLFGVDNKLFVKKLKQLMLQI